jgi:hypothetical protein
MVEKKLRKEIDGIVLELVEIGEELGQRFSVLKKTAKPVAVALVCIIVLKIAFRILRMILSILWEHKLLIGTMLIVGTLVFNKIRAEKQGEISR